MIISDAERAQVLSDAREMILAAARQQAVLSRVTANTSSVYANDDRAYTVRGTIAVMMTPDPPDTLSSRGAEIDATVTVLPEADVRPQDRMTYNGVTYRVQSVHDVDWFGLTVSRVLHLVTLHGV